MKKKPYLNLATQQLLTQIIKNQVKAELLKLNFYSGEHFDLAKEHLINCINELEWE